MQKKFSSAIRGLLLGTLCLAVGQLWAQSPKQQAGAVNDAPQSQMRSMTNAQRNSAAKSMAARRQNAARTVVAHPTSAPVQHPASETRNSKEN